MINTLRNIHEKLLNSVSDFVLAFEVLNHYRCQKWWRRKIKEAKKLLCEVFCFQNMEL